MTRKLLVVTDLGRFKAFVFEDSDEFSHPRVELIEEWETQVNERISDQVTDQAGQFSKGGLSFAAVSDMSNGEQHNLGLEQRRRAVKKVANRIHELIRDRKDLNGFYLAAGKEINTTLLEAMNAGDRSRVEKNVHSNLTRIPHPEVVHHFANSK